VIQESLDFDGKTFDRERDGSRLGAQLAAVRRAMEAEEWVTLAHLALLVDAPEASVSARLRDLRKPRHGGLIVERRYVSRGLWEYRIGAGK
jgi:hypothetical protein